MTGQGRHPIPGAAQHLASAVAAVRASAEDPVALVVVVAPAAASCVLARQSLALAGPFVRVRFLTPDQIVHGLGWQRAALAGDRPEPPGWLAVTLAHRVPQLSTEGELGPHGTALSAAGWTPALTRALTVLEGAGVTAGDLRRAAASYDDPERLRLLATLLDAVGAARAADQLAGPGRLADAALETLRHGDPNPLTRVDGFVIMGDVELPRRTHEVLAAWCAGRRGVRVLPPPLDALAPAPLGLSSAAVGAPLHPWPTLEGTRRDHLRAHLFREPCAPAPDIDDGTLELVSAADEIREMAEAARAALRAIRARTPLDRIAIALPTPDTADVLQGALADAGIPATWLTGPALIRTPAARLLLQAIDLAGSASVRRWYDVLRQPGLRLKRRLGPGAVAHRGRWRRILDQAGATEGADRIAAAVLAWREGCDAEDPEHTSDIEAADALLLSLRAIASAIAPFAERRTLAQHAHTWRAFLRDWWLPGIDRRRLENLIDSWGAADCGPQIDLPTARGLLEETLTHTPALEGELSDPAIRVLPPLMCVGATFDHVIVPGLVDGRFPVQPRDDELLPDALVVHLAKVTGVTLRRSADRIAEARRHLASAVSAAGGRLTLSFARVELAQGRPTLPSPFLLDAASALAGRRRGYHDLDAYCRIAPGRSRPAPTDPDDALGPCEHLVARLQADPVAAFPALLSHPTARRLVGLHRAIDRWRAAASGGMPTPCEWTGRVSPDLVPTLAAEPRSASAFQRAILDPADHFFRTLLGAWGPGGLPETPDPTGRYFQGDALHAALHRALRAPPDAPLLARFEESWRRGLEERLAHQDVDPGEIACATAMAMDTVSRLLAAHPKLERLAPIELEDTPIIGTPWTLRAIASLSGELGLVAVDRGKVARKALVLEDALGLVLEARAVGVHGIPSEALSRVSAGDGTAGEVRASDLALEVDAAIALALRRERAGVYPLASDRSRFHLERERADCRVKPTDPEWHDAVLGDSADAGPGAR